VRFDLLDILLPFTSAYRPTAVALSVLSAYGGVVVFGSFWLRRQIGQRTWRIVHILAFATFLSVTLHGMLAGTDSVTAWMRSVYLLSSGAFVWLLAYRVIARSSAGSSAEVGTATEASSLRQSQTGGARPAAAR
jgi:predicted ferric reductase